MNDNLIGCFASSIAGHDKCKTYIITDADDLYVYLADGKYKLIEKPKKKKGFMDKIKESLDDI